MSLYFDEASSVSLAGVDLSSYVKGVSLALGPWQESILDGLPAGSMTLTSWAPPLTFEIRWDRLPRGVRAYFLKLFARHRRLSRMRAAYRARRR